MKKVLGSKNRPRISVFRSNKEIYVQIIDDVSGKTLVSSSSKEKEFYKNKKNKTELSYEVGKLLGYRAKKLNLKKLVFDKGKYLYHGRVKSLAEGIREVGLEF
ncbi:50S ribosomal protein L18 [Blattabacterium sp. (Nauphoeta cinerea)]|uniref:50S ribosomal protein L18 n=1 Tax=Blattabacterium sp. (Nauphoeta cinerea) TaxID=1316444 RepID=UPI0005A4F1BA|nr:50S ribosomal protein L18 [Blattabacterium sp. (Nauphoeta cinerea)]